MSVAKEKNPPSSKIIDSVVTKMRNSLNRNSGGGNSGNVDIFSSSSSSAGIHNRTHSAVSRNSVVLFPDLDESLVDDKQFHEFDAFDAEVDVFVRKVEAVHNPANKSNVQKSYMKMVDAASKFKKLVDNKRKNSGNMMDLYESMKAKYRFVVLRHAMRLYEYM